MGHAARLRRRRAGEFSLPLNARKGPKPGPEVLPWYWHPGRFGIEQAPKAFLEKLAKIDPDLRAVFNPVLERWQIWIRRPANQNSLCAGWSLLFLWEHPTTKAFLPLDELVFHNLHLMDGTRFRNASEYFGKIEAEWEKNKEARSKAFDDTRKDMQADMMKTHVISSAGQGNRSALYDSGTVVPSRGEAAWRRETRKWRIPSELIQREANEKEQEYYGK